MSYTPEELDRMSTEVAHTADNDFAQALRQAAAQARVIAEMCEWIDNPSNGHSCSCDDFCVCGWQMDADDVRSAFSRLLTIHGLREPQG